MLYIYGVMWAVFGVGAITTAILNIVWAAKGKESKWFRFASLSMTALTLCAIHSLDAVWVMHADWSALEDVVPGVSRTLWILVLISIGLNSITLFRKGKE